MDGVNPTQTPDPGSRSPELRMTLDALGGLRDDLSGDALSYRPLPRLAPDGVAYLVVQKNLGSDSLQRWVEGELGLPCTRLASSKGFRVLAVRPAPG